jgi:TonB family protein
MLLLSLLALTSAADRPAHRARPESPLESYFQDDDYPAEAIRNEEQGTVVFALQISLTGAVTACSVARSSGSALLDSATCRLMTERIRFTPARTSKGRAVADTFKERVRWSLPASSPDIPPSTTLLRAINNVWEVNADGRQRSCRRELIFEAGDRINADVCAALDTKFVAAAAAYLGASPEQVLTLRLENRWLIDPVLPFPAPPLHHGELLARGEGSYRLNEDLSVSDCVEGRFAARLDWKPRPCFRNSFEGDVPPGTRDLRMEVQWVVSQGADTERPLQMPSIVRADGKIYSLNIRRLEGKEEGAEPR